MAGLDRAAWRSRRARMTVGAPDETGQEKQGGSTSGVKRQYMGCAGRVANGINTVHLSYVREKTGHALIGARQWIPAEDIQDPVKSLATGLPPGLRFHTKGQLAIDVLGDARADGVTFDFTCGDEVYGSSTQLRQDLEERGQAYVLCVASSFMLTLAAGTRMTCADAVRKLLRDKDRRWEVRSAGNGSKGGRSSRRVCRRGLRVALGTATLAAIAADVLVRRGHARVRGRDSAEDRGDGGHDSSSARSSRLKVPSHGRPGPRATPNLRSVAADLGIRRLIRPHPSTSTGVPGLPDAVERGDERVEVVDDLVAV
ncbi:MAG TPA: transposase [Trebonia sp.]